MKKGKNKYYKQKRLNRIKHIIFWMKIKKSCNKNLSSPIQECSEETIEELNNTFKDMAINSKEF